MIERRWAAIPLTAIVLAGCSAPAGQPPSRPSGSGATATAVDGAAGPPPTDARGKLEQALAAERANDYPRAQALLAEAEADAWLVDARMRNRLLLDIEARRTEIAAKRGAADKAAADAADPAKVGLPPPGQETVARAEPSAVKPEPPGPATTYAGMVVTLGGGSFASGSAALDARTAPVIDRLAAFLRSNPRHTVLVEGFTDSTGSAKANLALSERRANAVRLAIVKRGVALERIRVRGQGAAHPVASNQTEAGRQRNRRVEIAVSDADGRIAERQTATSGR